MPGIALSGLASGLDTNSLVSQLIQAESSGRTLLAQRQTKAEARVSVLQGIQSKLSSLSTATASLKSVTNWAPVQTATSSDTAIATATRTGGAGAGSYRLDVVALASSTQRTFTYSPPSGSTTMSFGGKSITLAAGATLDEAVTKINQAGADVIAVNAQGKLVVSSTTTGAASNYSWTQQNTGGGGLFGGPGTPTIKMDSEKIGGDARYRIDGGAEKTSATNKVTSAMPGIDVELKALGQASITVSTPAPDEDAIVKAVKGFVEAYNAAQDSARSALTEKPVKDATLSIDLKKGILFGDQGLARMGTMLRQTVLADVPGLPAAMNSLSDLGISTGAVTASTFSPEAVKGVLVLDEAKLREQIQQNPTGVRNLLGATTGTDGFAQKFDAQLDPFAKTGTGLDDRVTQGNADVKRLRESLQRFDDRLKTREDQLRRQFSAMESALAAAQAQQAQISQQISQLFG